jgi:hypothetical protein
MGVGKSVGLIVAVTGDLRGLQSSLGEAGKDVKGFGGISLGAAAKVAVVAGIAGVAASALFDMAKGAAADRTEQQSLQKVIEQAGAATGDYTAKVDEAIKAGQARAFTDSETRAALQSLVTATGDVSVATEQLKVAQDLARFANVDLATASDAVAKAYAGNDRALKTLVPGMTRGATAVDTIANAHKIAAGQADIYANSAEGMSARSADALGELGETIGSALLPVMDALLPALLPFIELLGQLIEAVLPILIPLLGVVGGAFKLLTGFISGAVKIVQDLIAWVNSLLQPLRDALNMLADLNPFGGDEVQHFTGGTGGGETGASLLGGSLIFNVYGDPVTIEATVVRALNQYTRKNGYAALTGDNR